MRSYLLGTLDDSMAATLEERYFTDRAFFLQVQAVETGLIEDYLDGRLAADEKRRFEQKYLTVPELLERLEEVRSTHQPAKAPLRWVPQLRPLLAAALLLVCVGLPALWLYRGRTRVTPVPPAREAPALVATISLSPGLLKGAGGVAEVRPRSEKGSVRLLLELPGRHTSSPYFARLSLATPEGSWDQVWSTAQPVSSTPIQAGQQISITLDASLLRRGDYLVEVSGADHEVIETYSFRVSSDSLPNQK